ncbi:uncharacterized protein LOC141637599 [Silene latifolia]|uniref:uncharacterized protein LOC141637599 n=1 Tax=Silene latifolia TaxID=37657 RepID=UPI003D78481B
MNTQEVIKDGYITEAFGAHSYKEVVISPPKKSVVGNGLFGLLETKTKSKAFNKAVSSFNNWCFSTNNGYHSGGRIWVLWNPKLFGVQVLEYNAQYIHQKVDSLVDRRVFCMTMVYAFNGIHDRDPLWDNLRRIANLVCGPWAVAGDFNCVLSATDRVGGNTPSLEMEPFRRCVADCGVLDITAIGSIFTWNNKQKPEERIYSKIDRLVKNLKNLKPALRSLNREGFSDIEISTNILQKQLQELSKARESFLSQKAKHQWIKEGDANSAYLHGMLKKRRNMNKVVMVEDMNGRMCDSQAHIHDAFLEYYQNLLGSSQDTKKIHKKIIDQGPIYNDENWVSLLKPVTGKEIKDALFSIPDIKSPGTDGYTNKFFKDAWGEIGGDVINVVQDFFHQRQLLKQINATNLTLIPKCDRPKIVLQYRPISCCNVAYQVISKLLCARLAEVLPHIVGNNQGAFIQHRRIQENILICQHLIILYERPHASLRCMFKIVLQKAYDTVEWSFVGQLLDVLNFPSDFKVMLIGDATSMMLLLQSFSTFFKASGLKDCECLVEKICNRIHSYGARKFSYAGRLVIVRSVLNSLHSYWASMFIIPKGIINRIEAVCRNLLWDNSADYRRTPLVGWDTVGRPKEKVGLGLKDQEIWNKAMVGRLVNWVAENRDSIWVKRVHQNYLKGQDWKDYKPSAN